MLSSGEERVVGEWIEPRALTGASLGCGGRYGTLGGLDSKVMLEQT